MAAIEYKLPYIGSMKLNERNRLSKIKPEDVKIGDKVETLLGWVTVQSIAKGDPTHVPKTLVFQCSQGAMYHAIVGRPIRVGVTTEAAVKIEMMTRAVRLLSAKLHDKAGEAGTLDLKSELREIAKNLYDATR